MSSGDLADLVRVLAALPEDQHASAAALLGFVYVPSVPERPAAGDGPPEPRGVVIVEAGAAPDAARDGITARLWRVDQYEEHGPPSRVAPAAPTPALPTGAGRSLLHRPRCPPITDWADLEPRLRAALAGRALGQELDVPEVVRSLGRGDVLTRLPRRAWSAWPSALAVWLDRSDRLVTVIEDQRDVLHHLVERCGRAALEVRFRVLDAAELAGAERRIGHFDDGHAPVVLVMTDLGACGTASDRRLWRATGEAVRRRGALAVALVPVGLDRVPDDVRDVWVVVPWQRHSVAASAARTEALLDRASPAALLQPSLLRRLRMTLPDADVGTELDALTHRDVVSVDAGAITLDPDRRQARLTALLDGPADAAQIGEIVRDWHKDLPEELAHAEVWSWLLSGSVAPPPGDRAAAEAFAGALLARLGAPGMDDWRHFAWQALANVQAFGDDALGRTLASLWACARPSGYAGPVPHGVEPAEGSQRTAGWWGLRQVGDVALVEPQPAVPDPALEPLRPGSPITRVYASYLWVGARSERTEVPLRAGARARLPAEGELTLEHDGATVKLVSDVPSWATAAGRDRYGVWAEATLYGVPHRLRWIPPGRFWMGSSETEVGRWGDEGPRHEVVLTRGLWLGETPVTQAQWMAAGSPNPSEYKGAERPVEQVSWHDARQFLGDLPGPDDGTVWRLPTEAEWERACRAETATATWRGDLLRTGGRVEVLDPIAWYDSNSQRGTRPVCTRDPNPWGLHDMLGNVWEWCEDAWRDSYGSDDVAVDPVYVAGRSAANRVIRGGSWRRSARDCRAGCRNHGEPSNRWSPLGFRLARGCPVQPGGQAGRDARGAVKAGDRPKQATTRPGTRREED